MKRSYYDAPISKFIGSEVDLILGALAAENKFELNPLQRNAWIFEIKHLQSVLKYFDNGHIFLEFVIPRMGRRVDAILLLNGIVFVVEYKVGADAFERHDLEQAQSYALDLKNFHETSHKLTIVPILVATNAVDPLMVSIQAVDGVLQVAKANTRTLGKLLQHYSMQFGDIALDPVRWAAGRYKPTPTIIEAAQALYQGHGVDEISHNEAGAINLSDTSNYINGVIEAARASNHKVICFVTGVPGSGKTLAGLNIATQRRNSKKDEHAVFLSGNGPLVDVLREALTIDAIERAKQKNEIRPKRKSIEDLTHAFIQNIHHFRDDSLTTNNAPVDKIVVFDEAQRAWDSKQTSKFMQSKRGQANFSMSEPQFLLSVMNRHEGWCAVICLVGGGQEINTGEAGIGEWLAALSKHFPNWEIHLSHEIPTLTTMNVTVEPKLHLAVSLRSYRAEYLSHFIGALIGNDVTEAMRLFSKLNDYPLFITRNLADARTWLRNQRRGNDRSGLLASSNAMRLKPEGIFVKAKIEPSKWFLEPADDIRSSISLEDAASEFDVQGLELDWTCVCWDANLRRAAGDWAGYNFSGSSWKEVHNDAIRTYLLNSYRVLLTRSRQGMIIFVPNGSQDDKTRLPMFYDPIYQFLQSIGIPTLPPQIASTDESGQINLDTMEVID